MIQLQMQPVAYCDLCRKRANPYDARCLECGVLAQFFGATIEEEP